MEAAGAATTIEPPAMEGVVRSCKRGREGPLLFGAQLIKDEGQEGEPAEAALQGAGYVAPSESPAKVTVLVRKARLHCSLCSGFFKPPIYLCAAGHLACCGCRVKLPDSGCPTCRDRGATSAYAHCPGLDLFFCDLRVPCPFEEYGCRAYRPYSHIAGHQKECEHAPCFCPEPGCCFICSPRTLLAHLTAGEHSWPVQEVPYGEPRLIAVSVPPADSPAADCRLLRGGDMSVFLMAVGPLGEGAAVSLVLVRAISPALRPRFSCTFYARPPPKAADLDRGCFYATMPVRSSTLADGAGVAPEKELYFAVPREVLNKASRELLLSVRIDRSLPEAGPPVHDDH